MDDLRVGSRLTIPVGELDFRFARAGGPGGQHVNKSSTKVELRWDVRGSAALSEGQRAMILQRLGGRIDETGLLRLSVQETRSQHRNRELAMERLAELVAGALKPQKKRRATRPSKGVKERRLRQKRQRSETKKRRSEGRGAKDYD
jgi:ribosome-associated protein